MELKKGPTSEWVKQKHDSASWKWKTPRQSIKFKKKRKRIKRNEDNLRDTWDNIKQGNINTRVVPEGEEN